MRRPRSRFALRAATCSLVGIAWLGAGCSVVHEAVVTKVSPSKPQESVSHIQAVVMGFADSYVDRLAQMCDDIANESPTPAARAQAGRNLASAATAVYSIATEQHPLLAISDMAVLVTLRRIVLERYWITFIPERLRPRAIEEAQVVEAEVWALAERYLTPVQVSELRAEIAAWVEANPSQNFVNRIRLGDLAARTATEHKGQSSGTSSLFSLLMIDPLAGIDPARREIEQTRMMAERVFFFMKRMPQLLAWQTEQVAYEFAATPEADKTFSATEDFARTARELSRFMEDFPEQRRQVLEGIAEATRQEGKVLIAELSAAVHEQREALVGDLEKHGPEVRTLLAEATGTLDAADRATESLRKATEAIDRFVARVDAPSEKESRPFEITQYTEVAREIAAASERLTETVIAMDRLLNAPAGGGGGAGGSGAGGGGVGEARGAGLAGQIPAVLTQAQESSAELIELMYRRAITVVGVAIVGTLLAALMYRFVSVRMVRRVV
jgi:hypothetical protein